jgi:arylsulfatase A-like enzyme
MNLRQRLTIAATMLAGFAAAALHAAGPPPPNFLFILTDDQRWDALGCAGISPAVTPNLDRLARRGMRFENAFVTLSICSPSRAAVLTSLYPSMNGVTTTAEAEPLRPGVETVAQEFQRAGWRTGVIGKWHMGSKPTACGFDDVRVFARPNATYYDRPVVVNGKPGKTPGFADNWVAEQSGEFMSAAAKERKPFFLWMCPQLPHMNDNLEWDVRPESLAKFEAAKLPVPETWNDTLEGKPPYLRDARSRTQGAAYGYTKREGIQRHWHRYLAAVFEVDAAIGRALAHLEELGLAENTYVIFMGDNGWFLGEHGLTSKVLAYEESMRVPMMVAGPGVSAGTDRHLVLNIDLPATMLDLAGREVPRAWSGRSLQPLLRHVPSEWRTSVYYESPSTVLGVHPLRAVRTDRWKFIRTFKDRLDGEMEFEELYDLATDPREKVNLAPDAAHAAQRTTMSELLNRSVHAMAAKNAR